MFKASAPGTMMLLGEYAVLHGKHAVVCAVDKRIYVTLAPREDNLINISSRLGHYSCSISKIKIAQPFQFVLTTLHLFKKQLPSGFDLIIETDFSEKVGLGSSAAVTVATIAALHAWLNLVSHPEEMIKTARKIIRRVQGLGSGADVAACVLGGVVAYKMQPFFAEKISHQFDLSAIYSGYKTPTVEAVNSIKTKYLSHAKIFDEIFRAIDACAVQGIHAIKNHDWELLGNVMNLQQGLMETLGVSNPLISELIDKLRSQKAIKGAKISGSGLGDCVIGLGVTLSLRFSNEAIKQIPISITSQGVTCEKN